MLAYVRFWLFQNRKNLKDLKHLKTKITSCKTYIFTAQPVNNKGRRHEQKDHAELKRSMVRVGESSEGWKVRAVPGTYQPPHETLVHCQDHNVWMSKILDGGESPGTPRPRTCSPLMALEDSGIFLVRIAWMTVDSALNKIDLGQRTFLWAFLI